MKLRPIVTLVLTALLAQAGLAAEPCFSARPGSRGAFHR
jgi:hypothetical protein